VRRVYYVLCEGKITRLVKRGYVELLQDIISVMAAYEYYDL